VVDGVGSLRVAIMAGIRLSELGQKAVICFHGNATARADIRSIRHCVFLEVNLIMV
jgi:hypothetical protein